MNSNCCSNNCFDNESDEESHKDCCDDCGNLPKDDCCDQCQSGNNDSCCSGCTFNCKGNLLISDQFNNRVIEATPRGEIVWMFGLGPNDFSQKSIIGVNDAQRIGNLTLMAGTGIPPNTVANAPNGVVDNRVILVNQAEQIVWQYGQFGVSGTGPNELNTPVQNTFVPFGFRRGCKIICTNFIFSGTILITDQGNNRIIRVNEAKDILWQFPTDPTDKTQLNTPNSAEQLDIGFILIADEGNNRAIIVDPRTNMIVRIFTAGGTLGGCAFASQLPSGNYLLTDTTNSRIVEVTPCDQIIWQYITDADFHSIPNPLPTRGLRLRDGDTLISDQFNNRVIRINKMNVMIGTYGLPLTGVLAPPFSLYGTNFGYNTLTTQLGLFSPYDAKIIGDYTGLTKP